MTDKVRAVFDLLGVEPNEEFTIEQSKGMLYKISEDLSMVYFYNSNGKCWWEADKGISDFLNGTYTIIKIPKKKKLRDITPVEWDGWIDNNCTSKKCVDCIFSYARCAKAKYGKFSWVNNKGLYSDKFLDQEIEVK